MSILEEVLLRIKKEFTHVRTIILKSDNARCYQNALLLTLVPVLSRTCGLYVVRFVHTEAQDRKSGLDACFGASSAWTDKYRRKGNNATTANQLVSALRDRGVMANCISELIRHDRLRLERLRTVAGPAVKSLDFYFKRV